MARDDQVRQRRWSLPVHGLWGHCLHANWQPHCLNWARQGPPRAGFAADLPRARLAPLPATPRHTPVRWHGDGRSGPLRLLASAGQVTHACHVPRSPTNVPHWGNESTRARQLAPQLTEGVQFNKGCGQLPESSDAGGQAPMSCRTLRSASPSMPAPAANHRGGCPADPCRRAEAALLSACTQRGA